MLCDKCKQRQANIHIKQSVNGVTTEKNLCQECASEEKGLMDAFSFSGGGFFDDLFETSLLKRGSGRMGSLFAPEAGQEAIAPKNSRYYAEFMGVDAPTYGGVALPEIKIDKKEKVKTVDAKEDLKRQLRAAVEKEDYEQAARLRDMIKEADSKKEDDKKTSS